jgi:hypothetical protein
VSAVRQETSSFAGALATLVLVCATCHAAEETPPLTTNYLTRVRDCLDALMEYGTDRYGATHAPILVSILDVASRTCPEKPAAYDEQWRVIRRDRRNPAGSNLLADQATLKTMYLLSATNGDKRYAAFADQYQRYVFGHLVDDRDLIWWGWHRHYDVYRDIMTGHEGNWHEIHAGNGIAWDRLWAVDPAATRREIEGIWHGHVVRKNGEVNRHAFQGPGCDFSMTAAAVLEAVVFLHARTSEKVWLDRAKLLANYYWSKRNPETDLFPERPNAGADRFDGAMFVTSITGPYCLAMLSAWRHTGDAMFRDQALAILKSYATRGYDPRTGRYWAALKLDGRPLPGPRRPAGRSEADYAQYEPCGHLDLWGPYILGYEHPLLTAQAYAQACEVTNDPDMLIAAERFADWIAATPAGTVESEVSWYAGYTHGPGKQGTYAGKYGQAVSFLVHLYVLTGKVRYLTQARGLADEALAKLGPDPLLRGHPAKPYYEAIDGVGNLLYALLVLDRVLQDPSAVVTRRAVVLGPGQSAEPISLDNR